MQTVVILFILSSFCFRQTPSAYILLLSNIPSPSHGLWCFKLIEGLTARGHNVTALLLNKPKNPIKGAYILGMEAVYKKAYETEPLIMQEFMNPGPFKEVEMFFKFVNLVCTEIMKMKEFEILLNYPNDFKFDLVINDMTCSNCLLGFVHKFNNPPLVGITPFKYTTKAAEIMGGHFYSGYIPRPTMPYDTNMSFLQRLENTAVVIYEIIYRKFIFQPGFDVLASTMFHDETLPGIHELEKQTAILLMNSHPATDFPTPLPRNIIEVGGLQIADPQPLPNDLEEFIQKSREGLVLIAFGTNVNSELFDDKQQMVIVKVAALFPEYNFIWKFEKDISQGKIPNLLVRKWLPQNDLLAHPKIRAFVSHGGGLSTQEAAWYGVPVIAIPFFMDQRTNSLKQAIAGVAMIVQVDKLTVGTLGKELHTILKDPSYSERMKMRSLRFRKRPMKPLDEAVWWIEYILMDPNPTHLRSPILHIGYFIANSYDVLILIVLIFAFTSYFLCRVILLGLNTLVGKNQKLKIKIN